MSEIKLITITIEGETATGKTAVLASIRDMLTEKGYCVTSPDKGQVLNPSDNLEQSEAWEKPKMHKTVFALTERNLRGRIKK